ncbi:MAG TPA: tRNA (adenosine(37)-N6)-threonylcarbamoyltransferase complex transferase subunit TsaD [Candidatus Saccharimonadales bacterium]|nr:tRNA (adenosine(37)-N6)-threonylcarbamoyltransferase complex transferase subunit TsaD [Candidatus Saccharimonadales bacterium]
MGIETSCDETAAAVVADGRQLLSNVVASSMDLHAIYGGVVPEIAARSHIESITPVIEQALAEADCSWDDIDGIAVTYGAGLGGSLLVGVLAARTLAIAKNKPLYACNHVIGHVYANFLTSVKKLSEHSEDAARSDAREDRAEASEAMLHPGRGEPLLKEESPSGEAHLPSGASLATLASSPPLPAALRAAPAPRTGAATLAAYSFPSRQPQFPLLAIIVSGGHSQLALFRDHFDYSLLGQTQDDAIGEAFDKVAKILGLPYPGGPSVSKKALEGDPFKYKLPKANVEGKYDYSFSGLKTAVLRLAQAETGHDYTFPSTKLPEALSDGQKADIAASFQRIAVETIVDKAVLACEEFQPASVVIAGGVAASPELRRQLTDRLPFPIEFPDLKLCTDNGAMIATLGCFMASTNQSQANPYSLDIQPNLSM